MFTESSKPTIAKNASDVAAVIARKAPLSPVSISVAPGRVAGSAEHRVEPDADDQEQAGQLDAGEHDVGLDGLADLQVDQGEAEDEDRRDGPGGELDELAQVGVTEGLRRWPPTSRQRP